MGNQIDSDATEFANHFKQGGWRLGLLVARSVVMQAKPGGIPTGDNGKVTTGEFAKKSGVSQTTVQYYFKAWELAADEGHCLHARELNPGDEDASIDHDEDDNESRIMWSKFYQKAREPKKPKQQVEKKPEPKVEAEANESEDETSTETDSFVINEAELDRQFRHDRIVNAREAFEAHATKLSEIGVVTEAEDVAALQDIYKYAQQILAQLEGLLNVS